MNSLNRFSAFGLIGIFVTILNTHFGNLWIVSLCLVRMFVKNVIVIIIVATAVAAAIKLSLSLLKHNLCLACSLIACMVIQVAYIAHWRVTGLATCRV